MVNEPPTINSVSHALRTIDLLARQTEPVGLSVISGGLDLPRATTVRVLNTLIDHGYVWKQDKRYALTLHLLSLAAALRSNRGVQSSVHAPLLTVMEQTHLTVHLALLDGDRAYYAAKVDPPGPLPMASYVGWRGPLHATGTGKALLANLPEGAWRAHLPGELESYTEHTITDLDQLGHSLDRARADGYALDDEELMHGLRCAAVAVPGQPELVVSASGPAAVLTDQAIPATIGSLRECATALSRGPGQPIG